MSTHNRIDARARFLAAVERVPNNAVGAVRLCAACVIALPVRRAAIAIFVHGVGLELLAASDQIAEQVEWKQVTLGEGPGVDAVVSGGPIAAPNLTQPDGRWPVFAADVADSGIGAMYALPLQVGAIRVGVLDLYCDTGESLSGPDFADAVAVSELLTSVLLTADSSGAIPESLGPWWNQPLGTREVHQATGMMMAQLGIDARSAYARLQAFAFGNSRQLDDVARDVVGRRLRFRPDSDGSSNTILPAPTR